jgi:hypothetical protein
LELEENDCRDAFSETGSDLNDSKQEHQVPYKWQIFWLSVHRSALQEIGAGSDGSSLLLAQHHYSELNSILV